jgi:D-3-phosphoglycerate dehydrogenase
MIMKNQKVLLLENIHPRGGELFLEAGLDTETIKSSLDEEELIERVNKEQVKILGIRSKTNLTDNFFKSCPDLLAVGAFCIGTNQIDLSSASNNGVAVFNAPYSNSRTVVELAVGLIINLMRKVSQKNRQMHRGVWDKSANGCLEIRGKTLGLVGYGNIGSQLSVLAESLGLNVIYYDLIERPSLGNATKIETLEELLNKSDIVSLHVDGRPENKGFFDKDKIDLMKQDSLIINLSRGNVIDVEYLAEKIKEGKIAGGAFDVFPKEPKSNQEEFISPLRGLDNVILTPHIGGSTEEAQFAIGDFVPNQILNYLHTGDTTMSVNLPKINLPPITGLTRFIHLHKNTPGILAKINNILANHQINIEGQYLKTNEEVGYVITDTSSEANSELISEFKSIPETITCRFLD